MTTDHTAEPASISWAEVEALSRSALEDAEARRTALAEREAAMDAEPLAQGGIVSPDVQPPRVEDPEVNGLATHLCSLDRCYPAPCADHLSTAGAALKWVANHRATERKPRVRLTAERPPVLGDCPNCNRPYTEIRGEPHDEDWSRGFVEVTSVARQWLPCGCTRIVPVGGDRG